MTIDIDSEMKEYLQKIARIERLKQEEGKEAKKIEKENIEA